MSMSTGISDIYHNCGLLFLVYLHYVWVVDQQLLVCLDLKVSQDLAPLLFWCRLPSGVAELPLPRITVGPPVQSVIQVNTQAPVTVHCFHLVHNVDGFLLPEVNHNLFCLTGINGKWTGSSMAHFHPPGALKALFTTCLTQPFPPALLCV